MRTDRHDVITEILAWIAQTKSHSTGWVVQLEDAFPERVPPKLPSVRNAAIGQPRSHGKLL